MDFLEVDGPNSYWVPSFLEVEVRAVTDGGGKDIKMGLEIEKASKLGGFVDFLNHLSKILQYFLLCVTSFTSLSFANFTDFSWNANSDS